MITRTEWESEARDKIMSAEDWLAQNEHVAKIVREIDELISNGNNMEQILVNDGSDDWGEDGAFLESTAESILDEWASEMEFEFDEDEARAEGQLNFQCEKCGENFWGMPEAHEQRADETDRGKIGKTTCPECGGVAWEMDDTK